MKRETKVHADSIALYLLGAVILAGEGFFVWVLIHLLVDARSRKATPSETLSRWRRRNHRV